VSRAGRRYIRTILLGTAALGALVWVAVDQFDIPLEEMLDLLILTVSVVGIVIVAAGLTLGVFVGLRKLLGRR
jgi:hypothetical protein